MSKKDRNFILETISLCARLGVSEIRVGDLHVSFGRESAAYANAQVPVSQDIPDVQSIPGYTQPELFDNYQSMQTMMDDPESFEDEIIKQQLGQGAIDENRRTQ